MQLSLTELRQRLYALADTVVDTGIPVEIERRGVRLRLIRVDEAARSGGRLARLREQSLVIGAALDPQESPTQWSEVAYTAKDPSVGLSINEPLVTPKRGRRGQR